MSDRSERREEVKLLLEYVKLALSIIGITAIIFAGLQWHLGNKNAAEATYARMATAWTDHLSTFLQYGELRPYFANSKQLMPGDKDTNVVLALADVRLDIMDAVLTYAAVRDIQPDIQGWKNTFATAFRNSSVMCARVAEERSNYGQIVPLAELACGPGSFR